MVEWWLGWRMYCMSVRCLPPLLWWIRPRGTASADAVWYAEWLAAATSPRGPHCPQQTGGTAHTNAAGHMTWGSSHRENGEVIGSATAPVPVQPSPAQHSSEGGVMWMNKSAGACLEPQGQNKGKRERAKEWERENLIHKFRSQISWSTHFSTRWRQD